MDWLASAQRWLYSGLADGIGGTATPGDVPALIGLAFVFGALHTFMPGHGKSLLVSYHLARNGSRFDGLKTASLLAATHIGIAVVLVLSGIAAIGGAFAGRNDAAGFEIASAVLIVLIGIYLTYRAWRPQLHERVKAGGFLALAAGAVPCPLTVFILTFAIMHEKTGAGLVAIAAMLLGAIATLSIFAIGAILTRIRLMAFLNRSSALRARIGRALEFAGAIGVLTLGLLMLAMRASGQ
ncbi:MAG: hypothetical protein SGJ07_08280 [Rhodospirillaceae bacterium]|nr:hypothetical protein [Rhodospirillaceae bacterium]